MDCHRIETLKPLTTMAGCQRYMIFDPCRQTAARATMLQHILGDISAHLAKQGLYVTEFSSMSEEMVLKPLHFLFEETILDYLRLLELMSESYL